jgi:hypothetical protein
MCVCLRWALRILACVLTERSDTHTQRQPDTFQAPSQTMQLRYHSNSKPQFTGQYSSHAGAPGGDGGGT